MSEDLKDILSNLNPEIDQETLMRYLQGKLSAQEQHEVEKQLMDSDFEADAMEGLQDFKNKNDISLLVSQLNKDLKKRTEKKKRLREKMTLKLEPPLAIITLIVLILLLISYLVLRFLIARTG
jgi:hypothetical protein